MTTAPVSVALYNEGSPSAGLDWIGGDALSHLADTHVAGVCEEQDIETVRMFVLQAPFFENDDCNDLLTEWIHDQVIPTGGPLPGQARLGGTIIASTIYNEDDYEYPMWTVLVLMPEPPFYQVGVAVLRPDGLVWLDDHPFVHHNLVHAINGDDYPNPDPLIPHHMVGPRAYGYVDLGGDV